MTTEIRKCILTGVTKPKEELLRFILLKDGTVVPDFNKRLEGHGFYISVSKKLLEGLTVKNPMNKILHTNTVVSADLPQTVGQILRQKGLDMLNIARKSGNLLMGSGQIKEAAAQGKIALLVIASDAGEDGRRKAESEAKGAEIFDMYDTETLSKALCRENTVYLAVKRSPAAKSVLSALKRYRTFLNE